MSVASRSAQYSRRHAMDRRFFFFGSMACTASAFSGPQGKWTAGRVFLTLPATTHSTSARDGTIEVTEVFVYTCVHCFRFESYIQEWLGHQPAYVQFERVPAIWADWQDPYARLYYTLQILKRSDLN